MPKLMIGCPVYDREWILDYWFEAIEQQTFPLSDIGFTFELGPDDDATHEKLYKWHYAHPEVEVFDPHINNEEKHYSHPEGHRKWNYGKYENMVRFRNNLLERIRCYAPERYFSLDSDILLRDPNTIQELWDLTERDEIDAVAPLMYMTKIGKEFPSVMTWTPQGTTRARRVLEDYPIGGLFQADIIMAAKMMSRSVYENVDYRFHKQGEDLGWSDECKREGFKLWSASYIYAPHIMDRNALETYLDGDDDRAP